MRKMPITGLVSLLAMAAASVALCADVTGTVSDSNGTPVAKIQIRAQDNSGKSAGSAITDSHGRYLITGLSPGPYTYLLDPGASGFKAGDAVAALGEKGLTINWKVSPDARALALASEGADDALAGDPFGLTASQFAALVVAGTRVIAGGIVVRIYSLLLAPPPLFRRPIAGIVTPLFAFLLWIGFQTVPLPPSLLRTVSPSTYLLYEHVFPEWPVKVPYSTPLRSAPSPIRSPETILPTAAEASRGAAVPFRAIEQRPRGRVPRAAAESFWIDALRWRSLSLAPSASRRAWLKFTACAAWFLAVALYPFGAVENGKRTDRAFMRRFFKALVLLAMVEGLIGVWGSVSGNRMVLELFRPLEWSRLPWGSRATGTFANPDHFAFFMNLVFPGAPTVSARLVSTRRCKAAPKKSSLWMTIAIRWAMERATLSCAPICPASILRRRSADGYRPAPVSRHAECPTWVRIANQHARSTTVCGRVFRISTRSPSSQIHVFSVLLSRWSRWYPGESIFPCAG